MALYDDDGGDDDDGDAGVCDDAGDDLRCKDSLNDTSVMTMRVDMPNTQCGAMPLTLIKEDKEKKNFTTVSQIPAKSSFSKAWILVIVLLLSQTFLQSFKPSSSYLPNFMKDMHGMTDDQINNSVMPVRTFAYCAAMIPMAILAEFFIGYQAVLAIGVSMRLAEHLILDYTRGQHWLQLSQIAHGLASSTRTTNSAFLYVVLPKEYFHLVTGYQRASNFGAQIFDGFIANTIVDNIGKPDCYSWLFKISQTNITLGFICLMAACVQLRFLNGSSQSTSTDRRQIAPSFSSSAEFLTTFKSIYSSPTVLLWSFWWWTAYTVEYLVDDLDTTLYLAIDPTVTKNGYVRTCVSIAVVSAVLISGYSEKFFRKHKVSLIVGGMVITGTFIQLSVYCNCIWVAYTLLTLSFFIHEFCFVACCSSIAHATPKANRGIVLFFNSFISLCMQSILQYSCQFLRLNVLGKFMVLGNVLYVSAVIILMVIWRFKTVLQFDEYLTTTDTTSKANECSKVCAVND